MPFGIELVESKQMSFRRHQATDGFWVSLLVTGFEGRQHCLGCLSGGLLPNPAQFFPDLFALTLWGGAGHTSLNMQPTALAGCGRKNFSQSRQQPVVTVGDEQSD